MKDTTNKKLNVVNRKPKYGMRKLSVGFVSCMLGATLVFGNVAPLIPLMSNQANVAYAAEVSAEEAKELVQKAEEAKTAYDDELAGLPKEGENAVINSENATKLNKLAKAVKDAKEKAKTAVDKLADTEQAKAELNTRLGKVTVPTDVTANDENNNGVIDITLKKPTEKVKVENASELSPDEQNAVKAKVKEANPKLQDDQIAVDTTGKVTVTKTVGKNTETAEIPAAYIVEELTAKEKADFDIERNANLAKQEIENTQNLSEKEIEDAKTAVDDKANAAKGEIKKAAGDNAVKQAKEKGLLDFHKETAKVTIQAAANKRKDDLDKMKTATPKEFTEEEIEAAKTAVDKKTTQEKAYVDTLEDKDLVNAAVTNAKKGIKEINPEKVALDLKAPRDKVKVNNIAQLTEPEKTAVKNAVAQVNADKGIIADDVTVDSDGTVTVTKDGRKGTLKAVDVVAAKTGEEKAKEKATADIDMKANLAKQEIQKMENLSEKEKEDAKAAVDNKADVAKGEINKATDYNEVKEAKKKGLLDFHKETAKVTIQAVANKRKAELNKMKTANPKEFMDEEIEAAKKAVDNKATQEKEHVDTLEDENFIKATGLISNAIENAQKEIEAINPKKAALDLKAPKDRVKVNDTAQLTEPEKTAVKNAVAQVNADKGIIADDVTVDSNGTVTVEKDGRKGTLKAADVVEAKTDVEKAKEEANEALQAKHDEIVKALYNGTDYELVTEKDAIKAKLAEKLTADKAKVDEAKTAEAVTKAKDDGLVDLQKEQAKADILRLAARKKDEIQQVENAELKDTTKANKSVDEVVKEELKKIDAAKDQAALNKATADATTAVTNKGDLEKEKVKADVELDQAAVAREAELDKMVTDGTATKQQVDAAKEELKKVLNGAKANVDNAKTPAEIRTKKAEGIKTIKEVKPLTEDEKTNLNAAKDSAKAEIENAVKDGKAAIDKLNLSKDKADTLKAALDQAKNAADEAIDKAESVDKVTEYKDKTLTHMAKQLAKASLTKQAEDKRAALAKENATEAEKEAANKKVEKALEDAIAKIDQATTMEAVKAAHEKAANAIKEVKIEKANTDLEEAKKAAKKALKDKYDEIIAALDNGTDYASVPEKEAIKTKLAQELQKANDAIDNATDQAGIDNAKTAGLLALNKEKAKADVLKNAAAKKDEIQQVPSAELEDTTKANKAVDEAVKEELKKIEAATTEAALKAAKTAADEKVNEVAALEKEKVKADVELDQAAAAREAELDKMVGKDGVTQEQVNKAKEEVKKVLKDEKAKVDNAKTAEEITNAKTAGVNAIKTVAPKTDEDQNALDQAKAAAKQALDAAKTTKEAEIAKMKDVDAKAKAEAELAKAYDKAVAIVEGAQTPEAATEAGKNGVKAIENVKTTEAPTPGKELTLNAPAEDKKVKVTDPEHLTDAEIAAVKAAVKAANPTLGDDATIKVAGNGKVTVTKGDKTATLEANKVIVAKTELEKAKEAVKAEIAKAVEDGKAAIDKLRLTEDQAKPLKDALDQAKKAADEAIDKAESEEKVTELKDKTLIHMSKPLAKASLTKKAEDKIAEIEKTKGFTETEKQTAKDKVTKALDEAIEKIDKATTMDTVKTAHEAGVNAINAVTAVHRGGGSGGSYVPSVPRRISGSNRIQTAIEVSKATYGDHAKVVVIANKDTYSDVLSAVPFAKQIGAPILLTNKDMTPDEVLKEIKRLGADKVIIIGGHSTITNGQELSLKKLFDVERIAGSDRYETSLKIAQRMMANRSKNIVEVASGEIYADALSMSSKATVDNAPILLVKKNSIPKGVSEFLKNYKPNEVNIAGGLDTVTAKVASDFKGLDSKPTVNRYSGRDRYETAVAIAKAARLNAEVGVYTSGENFADALVAGPYAAYRQAPVLIVKQSQLPASIEKYNKDSKIKTVEVIGGVSSVSDNVSKSIQKSVDR